MKSETLAFAADSEIHFLHTVVEACRAGGEKHDGIWQAAPVFCTIPFSPLGIKQLISLDATIRDVLPDLHRFASNRAARAYNSTKDTLTKPSYISRIRNFQNEGVGCQIKNIHNILREEPSSGGLVFSVFHPGDICKRFRPGYVPCLISGSFLIHDRHVQLNAFFRSQSVVEFGLHDLLFLRRLQHEVYSAAVQTRRLRTLRIGTLNLMLGRAIVQRRIARRRVSVARGTRKHVSIPRETIVPKWLKIVENQLRTSTPSQIMSEASIAA
jgi:hypothetical protein